MDQVLGLSGSRSGAGQIVRSAFADCEDVNAIDRLAGILVPEDLAMVILFLSPSANVDALIAEAKQRFAPVPVVGCTTAGEISPAGYTEGEIVAVGLPSSNFLAQTILVPDLDDFQGQSLIESMIRERNVMAAVEPDWKSEFTFLLIDGLSTREDALTAELAMGLGPVPLFGGSAGDGENFESTRILYDGQALPNAAVLIQVRSNCPIKVFNTDHLIPTEARMVVTSADPARRVVHEINAEPAAGEFARIVGKNPDQLDTFTFAAHPVVVRIGDHHHVRAIQQVDENGDLVFFSAIDEGVVLTLAEPENMVIHLTRELERLSEKGAPDTILGCDCVLRRIEAQQKQMTGDLSRLLSKHRVVGFSTYGEQVNTMHVNHTLTGVAIYPPDTQG
ncbi:FIST N-terminal domain-containing protein [Phaeobacter marinintestinus]|uniref:FIST N-terminal domain-containing protein n=1 Tax=Falsiphaeobacter marinintestinus TaxID=1492905 RepID=UPI0011B7D720|nr:FIST N-terminal domain-containing protein [Phaeobacter marinintestinus]